MSTASNRGSVHDEVAALREVARAAYEYRALVRAPYAPSDVEFEKWYALLGSADKRLAAALEDAAWEKRSGER